MQPEDYQKAKTILLNLSQSISEIDTSQDSISKIVKRLDSMAQAAYSDLYKIIDGRERLNQKTSTKNGHCC